MNYLIDASALTRVLRKQADPSWNAVEDRGLLSVCEPILAETLLIASSKEYEATEENLVLRFLPVAVPDGIWGLVAAIRRDLVPHGAHRGLSVADLVIAATAIRLKLTVLHEDADFETVARYVPEMRQHRLSAGPP
ncbi:PIN domain-containing protein [Paractinoplanes rhizophilus]|uniref:Ribonuclease VapC n=1 Tax=Paractinoplanes rhizophilus TaxID=1416877 RepID=A0ABW2HZ93_9ACTN